MQHSSDQSCIRCKCEGHLFRNYPNNIVCNVCSESGHKQSNCEKYKSTQLYGDYAYEIAKDLEASVDGIPNAAEFHGPDKDDRNVDINV